MLYFGPEVHVLHVDGGAMQWRRVEPELAWPNLDDGERPFTWARLAAPRDFRSLEVGTQSRAPGRRDWSSNVPRSLSARASRSKATAQVPESPAARAGHCSVARLLSRNQAIQDTLYVHQIKLF